jgi:uncharacterized protein (TIGR03437 family)
MIARYADGVSRLFGVLLCLPWSGLLAQPAIGQNGVVNRASLIPPTLPGGSIARGAAFTIHGVRFGSAAAVSLRSGKVTLPVRVLAVEPEKIEAIMPDAAPLGAGLLVVKAGQSASKPFSMEVAASNPGIFSQNKRGWGPGQIENIDSNGARALNSITNPAHPGQRVAMRITGLGRGAAAAVVVGNRTVNAQLGRTIPQAGEQEISFAIPTDAPMGCFVPVYLKASPIRASNVVTVAVYSGAVHSSSGQCDPGPIPLLEQKRVGLAVLSRVAMITEDSDSVTDSFGAIFSVKGDGTRLSPLRLLPPPGTCTAYTSSFQGADAFPVSIAAMLMAELGSEGLAAGPRLTVARENHRRDVPADRAAPGYYRAELEPRLFEPGEFVLSSVGGMDVGPFRVTVEGPVPFEWTDRNDRESVDRTRPLPLHWRGQASGHWTIILARNVDQITTANATCLCIAPLNATHFEIPAALLANIPDSVDMPGIPYDQLFVASLAAKTTPLAALGIGGGAVFSLYANGRLVRYY